MNCKECAKQFTCKEYEKEECTDKIKFSQAGIIDKPKVEKRANELQHEISKAIEKALNNPDIGNPIGNNPIYEYVATFDAGRFTRYIGE